MNVMKSNREKWRATWLMAVALLAGTHSLLAQESVEQRLARLESLMEEQQARQQEMKSSQLPQLHGIIRGKYEYQPEMDASRFEVRNARLSAEGKLTKRSAYKLEIDLCDESEIKMKDAWVRLTPIATLRATVGQQRMPFSIDAHRNPSAQYFANRSFIAKQVGNMRDVGFQLGYDVMVADGGARRKLLSVDAGLFNGSNLDDQKQAWFSHPGYSARLQFYPVEGLALVPSIQHQQIAQRQASYTSLDMGLWFERYGWHLEAEYLHKSYAHDAFSSCNAVNAMAIYRHPVAGKESYLSAVSGLLRYDYMDDHSNGKSGLDEAGRLKQTDAERHRLTAGCTFSVRNAFFPTDIRLNYERYWYPHGGVAKESEQDKLVVELMVRF